MKKITGKENHRISLAKAAQLTRNYRRKMKKGGIKGSYISRSAVLSILKQKDCLGLRIYHGLSVAGKANLVLVGVNKDGNDMVKGVIAEKLWPCPPFCPDANELNS
jgi:hypothetical protein